MTATILTGDVIEQLRTLPDNSVQCVVTSPPYYGLRNYGVPGQIGMERTPELYVARMVEVFREVRRILREDGVCWLNLGDSYNGSGGAGGDYAAGGLKDGQPRYPGRNISTLKPKDLIGIPWRVAFALQANGWWLRSAAPWVKRSAMPESVTDRPTSALEYIFLLAKSQAYFYDAEAVRKPKADSTITDYRTNDNGHRRERNYPGAQTNGGTNLGGSEGNRNRRNTDWFFESLDEPLGLIADDDGLPLAFDVNPAAYKEAHFATFPPKLVEPCIKAGTSEHGCCPTCGAPWKRVVEREGGTNGDNLGKRPDNPRNGIRGSGLARPPKEAGTATLTTTGWRPTCTCQLDPDTATQVPCTVLDPFAGSGTTLAVALALGRNAIGIELNPEYVRLAERRLAGITPALFGV